MSQNYLPQSKGKSPETDDGDDTGSASTAFYTVGTGSSQHAARLQVMLDNNSGDYGGDDASPPSRALTPWNNAHHDDRHSHLAPAGHPDRRSQASAVHQLWYNQHRVALGRAIYRVIELLKGLQEMNATWPAHYPTVQRAETSQSPRSTSRSTSRPTFSHANSTSANMAGPSSRHGPLRRALTAFSESSEAESSKTAEGRSPAEPRLVTPQLAHEFSVLKLDLKLGGLHQTELVHSLEKASVASLLDGKVSSSINHLLALRDRIEDTSSKVLVTGDLNAGKSTFCNALLRRRILPVDQQPCTSIFCEVLDARENSGIEEVHAVHRDAFYDRNDETTYDVYALAELENLVIDNTKYTQCKVYVKDARSIDESLLNNGVVDIALIDAPGLNSDTTKTTAVFARQEEIDVVVFVVSAANHFTMTAKEFIWAAAAEKAYLFIVVNGYDNIRDKKRCERMILEQVANLSPRTFKESSELVHFVSSNAVPVAPAPPGGPGGSGSASGGGGGGDEPDDGGKGKGKDKEKIQDFTNLEQSLRRFVLEKRARSKLAPVKHYLHNILNDIHSLATVNTEIAQAELDRVVHELEELEPMLESRKKAKIEAGEEIERTIEETCRMIFDHTRHTLTQAIARAGDGDLGVPYPGLFSAFQYAEAVKEAMLSEVAASVENCEGFARTQTVVGVNSFKQLGILHLGNEYVDLNFRPDAMFRRKRDALARQINVSTELWDFVDWNTLLQRQEKVAGTGMALTVATAIGTQLVGGGSWVNHALSAMRVLGPENVRRMFIPGILVTVIAASYYILSQVPHSLPHRLSNKISAQLAEMDYIHNNSSRISSSVRKVLRFPADNLRSGLERNVEQLGAHQEETLKVRAESDVALKYFSNLVRDSGQQRSMVAEIDLDVHPPGATSL